MDISTKPNRRKWKYGTTRNGNRRKKPCKNGLNPVTDKCIRLSRKKNVSKTSPVHAIETKSPIRLPPRLPSPLPPRLATPSPQRPSPVDLKQVAKEFYARYNPAYKPPVWALDKFNPEDARMKSVQVYTTAHRDDPALLQCLVEREPVNIAMNQYYKDPSDSGYMKWYKEHKTLGPNLAVYAHCEMSKSQNRLKTPIMVHVMNSIAFGFDSTEQPDYDYYMRNYNAKKERELLEAMTDVIRLIFTCAVDHKLSKICLSYIGGGFFKEKFKPRKDCIYKTYLDFFMEAFERANCVLVDAGVVLDEVSVMRDDSVYMRIYDLIENNKVNIANTNLVGDIPDILDETALFVNAWDPHSVVGNGNAQDKSLDGYFGRLSDLALLCTPLTNPNVLHNIRTVKHCSK